MLFGAKKDTTVKTSVDLTKAKIELDKSIIRLEKSTGVNLSEHKARVFVVVDRSGSMSDLYYNGEVQRVLTRLLPLALKFDDNGELEVFVFNTRCDQMANMDINNYADYVQKKILGKGFSPTSGTNYAPVIKKTMQDKNDKSPYPSFGIVITDGENYDREETDEAVRKSSKTKTFYQFVGIGNENFNYLQKLDDLSGREVDNTAFIKVSDFDKLDDQQLYDLLLEQYPQWLRAMNIN